ncbi:uncharacterized protein [Macrobrachium rosenbergii]
MPRKYVRVSSRGEWNEAAMKSAIAAVREKKMGLKKASKEFSVPKTTLGRRVRDKNKIATGSTKMLGPIRTVFSAAQEAELVTHILLMEDRFFGLTARDVRYIAFHAAERNNVDHKFNKMAGLAGKDWLLGFQRRHPELAIRTPEPASAAQARCFNQANTNKFFDILSSVQAQNSFPPHRIFNVDETGITTVQTKPTRILALRGKKQVGTLSSAERGVLATAVCCMSAGGQFVPPFFIFPRVRMKQELKDGAPPATGFACHPSGWMQLSIFTKWFLHFLAHTKPSVDDPALLIMDGHMIHIKNLDVINLARDNYVTIVILPPHCSHRMQPLDVSFMKPLNAYYVRAIETFLRNNPGRQVTIYKLSALFGEAYLQAAVPNTAINGFKKTGICPLNKHVFGEADFLPAHPTDIPLNGEQEEEDPDDPVAPPIMTTENEPELEVADEPEHPSAVPEPVAPNVTRNLFRPASSPQEIIPLSKVATTTQKKRPRSQGRALFMTASPYKKELTLAKKCKERETRRKPESLASKYRSNKSMIKHKTTQQAKAGPSWVHESDSENEGDSTVCLYCSDTFGNSLRGEGWVCCAICKRWAHEQCAEMQDDEEEVFVNELYQ